MNVTGGYDPTSTAADAPLIRAQLKVLSRARHRADAVAAQRAARGRATCSPASRSSSPPATSAWVTACGAHAPDEYYVIESTNKNFLGIDRVVRSSTTCTGVKKGRPLFTFSGFQQRAARRGLRALRAVQLVGFERFNRIDERLRLRIVRGHFERELALRLRHAIALAFELFAGCVAPERSPSRGTPASFATCRP